MDQDTINLTLTPERAFFILLRAREFDEKVDNSDPDSGSNATDDGAVDVLESNPDDTTEAELKGAVRSLNDDELLDLIALIWIGRGDFSVGEWDEAREAARDIGRARAPRYVAGIPLVSDYLEDGLSEFDLSLVDYMEDGREPSGE
ncbi:MAG TPA: DUF3775 domain-containing protein [Caulobacteraceae bacterium]|nr:DUF3775 domain-containing protein [Caulobacteraceae bacterium]